MKSEKCPDAFSHAVTPLGRAALLAALAVGAGAEIAAAAVAEAAVAGALAVGGVALPLALGAARGASLDSG